MDRTPVDNEWVQSPWSIVLRRLGVVLVATTALVAATAVPGMLLSDRHDADERARLVRLDEQIDRFLERAQDPESIERLRERLQSMPPVLIDPEAARLYKCLFESDEDDEDCERP